MSRAKNAEYAARDANQRAALDKANTASEMRTASLDQQMDDVLNRSAIDNQLAERKKKLGLAQ